MTTEKLHFAFMESGIARGTLTEICGPPGGGKTEAAINFISSNPSLHAAWIEHSFTLYPTAFANAGLNLDQILFVEAGREALWTALQTMRSGVFGIVVMSAERPITALEARRLQLEAEKSQTCVVMITDYPSSAAIWPLSLQITVIRTESDTLRLDVTRARGQNSAHANPHRAIS